MEIRTFGKGEDGAEIELGTGSCLIVDRSGYILTCLHVVNGADRISVELENIHLTATVLARDETLDLALIHVDRQLPAAIVWGDSKALRLGDTVYAIGFPFDIARLLRRGTVAATAFEIEHSPFFVTDAQINPGDSGGGMFNENGELVGLPARIQSVQGLSANIGLAFAIPSDVAHWFVTHNMDVRVSSEL